MSEFIINSEAEVINLIGYETAMRFLFYSDGIITYKTVIPKDNDMCFYEVSFFVDDGLDFFAFDSFSNFLEKFQINEVKRVSLNGKEVNNIYFKEYQK